MPTVTKHTSNNLVTVSYPVRDAVLDITQAEHALILADDSTSHKVKMIKFIRAQYNLGLYDAKQVVDTVIEANEKLQTINKYTQEPVQGVTKQPEVEWSTVPEGSMIFVREDENCGWNEREFVRYNKNDEFNMPFICRNLHDVCSTVNWKFGKLISISSPS